MPSVWSTTHVAMAALLFVAWSVRLLAYAPAELGLDGHLSVGLALQPVPRLLAFLARDVHPPFFYLVLKAWLDVAGTSYLAARWLDVAAGTLTLAVVFRFVASLAGVRAAVMAVALLVLSPAHVGASATVRDFGLGLFLSVCSLAAWRALDRSGGTRRWICLTALVVSTALALATWYFHALVVAAQIVALFVSRKDWRARLVALTTGVVAQLPWAIVALGPMVAKASQGVTVSGQAPAAVSVRAVLSDLGTSLAGHLPTPVGHLIPTGAWLILIAWGIAVGDQEPTARRGMALVAFFGLCAGLLAIYGLASRWAGPSLLGRYGLVLLPWAALAQAWALGKIAPVSASDGTYENNESRSKVDPVGAHGRAPLPQVIASAAATRRQRQSANRQIGPTEPRVVSSYATFLRLALATVVLLGQGTDYISLERLEGWPWQRQISLVPEMELTTRAGQPTDYVVLTDLARAGQYALRGDARLPSTTIHIAGSAFLRDDVGAAASTLEPRLHNIPGIWLLYDRPIDGASLGQIVDLVGQERYLTIEESFENAAVDRFEVGPALARHVVSERFGSSIVLVDWSASPTVPVGSTVYIDLRWQTSGSIDANYTVFVHLIDANGQKVAQHDGAPALGRRPTTTWQPGEIIDDRIALPMPKTAAPGRYRVVVGLYRGAQRLPRPNGADSLEIGPIEATR